MRQHRTVADLMTSSVVRVHADTPFKDIATLLADNDITAVPVVDGDDRVIGVVSEADLLRKEAGQPDSSGLLPARRPDAGERARQEATDAKGLMSAPAVIAHREWTVAQTARVMESRRVKRLPVVDGTGRLVGVVSRADLLRVFLRRDHAIREEISGDVLDRTLGITALDVVVRVTDGRVELRGTVDRSSQIALAVRLCQAVDGVVQVTEQLDYRADDSIAADAADTDDANATAAAQRAVEPPSRSASLPRALFSVRLPSTARPSSV